LRKGLPELPHEKRLRFMSAHGLTPYMAEILTSSRAVADYYEQTLQFCNDAKLAANWVMGEVLRLQKDKNSMVEMLKVTPKRLASLLILVSNNTISAQAAKKVFDLIEAHDKDPEVIVEEQGLKQISDTNALEKVVRDILEKNQAEVARYKAGEKKIMGFFVGEAMKLTKVKATRRK